MAVEAATIKASPATEPGPRPYAASWLDRLLDAIDALPGPAPLAYLALGTAAVVLMYAQPWTMGAQSPFEPVERLYWGGMIGVQIAAAGYVRRVAGSAFDAFRPALRLPEAELAVLRYRLVVIPAGAAFAAAGSGIALAAVSLAINPAATTSAPLTGTQQRDVLAKLPTWPWSVGTLRGFVTAILLPLVLFLIQMLLSRAI